MVMDGVSAGFLDARKRDIYHEYIEWNIEAYSVGYRCYHYYYTLSTTCAFPASTAAAAAVADTTNSLHI
jgi:hypothetical protein